MKHKSVPRSAARATLIQVLGLVMTSSSPAWANDPFDVVEEAQLDFPTAAGWYGSAVAVSGGTAVVGAWRFPVPSFNLPGAIFVHERIGGVWTPPTEPFLAPPGFILHDARFGHAVAIDRDTLAVGAPGDRAFALGAGAVYVFERNGGSWTHQATLFVPATPSPQGAGLGSSLALEGDTLVAGAASRAAPGGQPTDTGSALVFERSGGTWSLVAELYAPDPAPGDDFGCAVALSGSRLVVGARFKARGGASDAGAAFVYRRTAGVWQYEAELIAPDSSGNENMGESVALDGDTAIVGAPYHHHTTAYAEGVARVFVRTANGWSEETELLPGNPGSHSEFGEAVALSGNRAVIGDHNQGIAGNWSGSVTVFEREGGVWRGGVEVVAGSTTQGDNLGHAVAIDGDTVIAGAPSATAPKAHAFLVVPASEVGSRYCFGLGCPCSNDDASAGCANTSGQGASLTGTGSDVAAADALCLVAERLVPGQPALLFAGLNATNGGAGAVFGNGLRCAGGGVVRLGVRVPDGGGHATWGPGFGATPGWGAGDTRHLQAWYRDPAHACGGGFNLSNGVRVTFQ